MNVFMGKIKRTSEYVAMVLFFVAAFFSLLYYIGNFDAEFMPVIGNLFAMVLQLGIWLVVPVCIVMKRRSYARWAALAVALYWFITTLFSLLRDTALARGGLPALTISVGVFSFLTACALIVMTAFALTALTRKDGKIKMVAACVYAGALVFYLVLFALRVALAAKGASGWSVYFELICDYLVIPLAMFFIAIAFGFKEEEFVLPCKKKTVTAPKAEEAPAASAETSPAPLASPATAETSAESSHDEIPNLEESRVEETPAAEAHVEEVSSEAEVIAEGLGEDECDPPVSEVPLEGEDPADGE